MKKLFKNMSSDIYILLASLSGWQVDQAIRYGLEWFLYRTLLAQQRSDQSVELDPKDCSNNIY